MLELNGLIAERFLKQCLNCIVELASKVTEPDHVKGAVDERTAIAVDEKGPPLLTSAVRESVADKKSTAAARTLSG